MNTTAKLWKKARKNAKAHSNDKYARNARLAKWGLCK